MSEGLHDIILTEILLGEALDTTSMRQLLEDLCDMTPMRLFIGDPTGRLSMLTWKVNCRYSYLNNYDVGDVFHEENMPKGEANCTYSYSNNYNVGDVTFCEENKHEMDSLMMMKCNGNEEKTMDDRYV